MSPAKWGGPALLAAALLAGCGKSGAPGPAPRADWLADLPAALARAQAENKPLLIAFGGSDWCAPCIANRQEVLDTAAFREFADRRLVLLEVDLPRLHDLPPALEAQNMAMFEGFGAPLLPVYYLFAPNRLQLGKIESYQPGGPEPFLGKIEALLAHLPPAPPGPASPVLATPPASPQPLDAIEIRGAVIHPGWFMPLPGERVTVSALVDAAGGPASTTSGMAEITRQNPDGTKSNFEANLRNIVRKTEPEVELRPGDRVFLPAGLIGGTN